MRKRLWTLLILGVLLQHIPMQGQTLFRLGPALGLLTQDFTAVLPVGNARSVLPVSSTSFFGGLNGSVHLPVSELFNIRGDLSGLYYYGSAETSFPIVVVVEGQAAPGEILRDHTLNGTQWSFGTGLDIRLSPVTWISGLLGVTIPQTMSISADDRIVSPSTATFVSSGTNTRSLEGGWPKGGPVQSYLNVGAEVSHAFRIRNSYNLTTYVRATYAATSALSEASWHPFQMTLGLSLQLPGQTETTDDDVTILPYQKTNLVEAKTHVFRDTTVVITPYNPADSSIRIETDSTQEIVTTVGPTGDTVHTIKRYMVQKYIPAPPPFLSSVLDVAVTDNTNDSMIVVSVDLETIADTAFTALIECSERGVVFWSGESSRQSYKNDIHLANEIKDLATLDEVRISISATITDAVGQSLQVPIREIVLRRSAGERLQED